MENPLLKYLKRKKENFSFKEIYRKNRLWTIFILFSAVFFLSMTVNIEHASSRQKSLPPDESEKNYLLNMIREEKKITIPKGGTLVGFLKKNGIPEQEISGAIDSLVKIYDPKYIQPGQEVIIITAEGDENKTPCLETMRLRTSLDNEIRVSYKEGSYEARNIQIPLKSETKIATGTIRSSFFRDLSLAGVPDPIIMDLFRYYSFDVDFQRDIQKDDTFEVMYDELSDMQGNRSKNGSVIFANLNTMGTSLKIYRFETDNGTYDFFNENGKSVRKTLLKTPVRNAVISSGFGRRIHPIYGYSYVHKGLDFAAPKNTPIVAAGNGVVELAKWNGGYGNCVIIRHANQYKTLYGHMNAYAKGIRKGARVNQGQVIGYIGTTGVSTGYHLHYEVIFRGVKINPASLKSPPEKKLTKDELERFYKYRDETDSRFIDLKNMS